MDMTQPPSSISLQPIPHNWIERLFDKMLLDYGRKFTDQWGGADPDKLIAHWSTSLAGYTRDELARGAAALDKRDWPPTLPEFKRMCRVEIDATVAYYEALNGVAARSRGEMGEWSSPAVYWAAMPLAFDLGSQTYSQIKERWKAAYEKQVEKGAWDPIPVAMVAIAAPEKTFDKKAAEKAATEALANLGAASIVKPKAYQTQWYRDILEREKKGDKTLTMIQLRFAREAAANHNYSH